MHLLQPRATNRFMFHGKAAISMLKHRHAADNHIVDAKLPQLLRYFP